jgi:hypothetical protein
MKNFKSFYFVESVWSDAEKKFDPELVKKFREHLKDKRISANIQQIRTEDELKKHIKAGDLRVSPRVVDELEQEEKEGTKVVYNAKGVKIFRVVKQEDLSKINFSREWCIVGGFGDPKETFDNYHKIYRMYIVNVDSSVKDNPKFYMEGEYQGEEVTEYIFPVAVMIERENEVMHVWDNTNNMFDGVPHEDDWLEEHVTEPLKIPIEIFK